MEMKRIVLPLGHYIIIFKQWEYNRSNSANFD